MFGLDAQAERLYRKLRGADGTSVEAVAAALAVPTQQLLDDLQPLIGLGVAKITDGTVGVVPPRTALSLLLAHEAAAVVESAKRFGRLANAVPYIKDDLPEDDSEGISVDAYIVRGPGAGELVEEWIRESSGELMFLRPDQWRMPSEPLIAAAFEAALADGRRARSIYPVRAMREAPAMLNRRASAGEEIRLLPHVPTRMSIVGRGRGLLPDMPGAANLRSLVLRDPGLVSLMRNYFEELWDKAVVLPEDDHDEQEARRLLLAELADGARDEQIAESLGIGLRTVRRRVAHLLDDLGVDTRFQAGVEAVRRGWL